MKILKRISIMMLAICLMLPCFSIVAKAAEGVIFFTDLDTKVGDTFQITGTVVSKGGNLQDVSIQMSYDTSYIRFVSGDGVNADSDGNLTYTGSGSSERLEFTMTFQALQEGTTRIDQGTATVTTSDGETLDCTNGYSDIAIGEGDPGLITETGATKDITIDGVQYTLSEAFSDNEIPSGFEAGEITYDGVNYKGATQSASGLTLAYLVDNNQAGAFWVYNSEAQTFSPCEEILISDEYSIVVFDARDEVKMPSQYEEGTMEINGNSFPIWYEPSRDGFYILYAVNNEGDKSLYLYDSLEHTYQRMETPKAVAETKVETGLWSKISDFITTYLIWFVVGIGCILLIGIIFMIVIAVKLHHRNVELDDLYDEYGIDDQEKQVPASQNKNSKRSRKSYDEDDFDNYYEEDNYYYDDEDDYYGDDDDELLELRKDFEAAKPSNNFEDYYDDDDFEEDESYTSMRTAKKRDDTFTMDFIDLD